MLAVCAAVAVAAGAVLPLSAAELTHRWSFNGDYSDSVGGVDAVKCGTYVPLLFALSMSEIDWRGNRTEKNGDYRSWGRPPFNLVRSSFAETPQEAK